MFSRIFQQFRAHKHSTIGLPAILLFIVIGIIVYALMEKHLISEGFSIPLLTRSLLIGGILGYGIILMIWLWIIHSRTLKPTKKLIQTGKKLSSQDFMDLVNAITELSQGDLSKQISIDAKPLSRTKQSELNEVVEILNSMIGNLKDAATAFNTVTNIPCRNLCYVGADSFLEGRRCGELMGEYLQGRGKVLIFAESLTASNLDLRRRGFQSVFIEKYPNIRIDDAVELRSDREMNLRIVRDTLKRYPQTSGIYTLDGGSPPYIGQIVDELNKSKQITVIAHDLTDETMNYLKKGVITATLGQDPYAQGYNPVIHLFNHLTTGWKPIVPYLLTTMDVVTIDNYQEFWQEGRGTILSQLVSERLAKPLAEKNEKSLRIVVLGREDSKFWIPVKDGVLDAAKKLKSYNTIVEWIVPEKARDAKAISADIYGPAMLELVKKGCNGIAVMVHDKELIPYINQSVDQGMPIALFNSDPTSLRGLIFTITKLAENLMGLSENLASSTYQTSQATFQIKDAMNNVAQETKSQNIQVTKTDDSLQNLLNTIDIVSRDTEDSVRASEETTEAVNTGTEAMNRTLSSMQVIEKSVSNTWSIVGELEKHSERIDAVVELIDDIASRVNVLALNASIEATKAGEYGKGFMVVANEIRKLAKNTAEATREVAELINTVQRDILKVEKVMADGLDKVKSSSELTDNAMDALSDIQRKVEIDKKRILKIAKAMIEMQNTSHQVGDAMDHVARASEKNMAAVTQVNTLTKEMTAQLEDVAELAMSLESMAKGEQKMLAKFNLLEDVNQ